MRYLLVLVFVGKGILALGIETSLQIYGLVNHNTIFKTSNPSLDTSFDPSSSPITTLPSWGWSAGAGCDFLLDKKNKLIMSGALQFSQYTTKTAVSLEQAEYNKKYFVDPLLSEVDKVSKVSVPLSFGISFKRYVFNIGYDISFVEKGKSTLELLSGEQIGPIYSKTIFDIHASLIIYGRIFILNNLMIRLGFENKLQSAAGQNFVNLGLQYNLKLKK